MAEEFEKNPKQLLSEINLLISDDPLSEAKREQQILE
jgi:hypothetical protein